MIWRGPEQDVIPFCAEHGISQIVWSPLGQGVLTGKYEPGRPPPADSRMSSERMGYFMDRFRDDVLLRRVQELGPIADELGITMARLALAWVLREPNVASAIIGATRAEQVADNAAASGIDRLDELEDFMLRLQPDETFRPHSLWRLPLLGSHDYRLPETIAERLGDIRDLARALAGGPVELVVVATDVTDDAHGGGVHAYELVYSSRSTAPETMAEAMLGSAAISALVLPRRIGDRIATDGSWVRNFPLGHAYQQPGVELIVSFRYVPTYPRRTAGGLPTL